jgi:pSer/pThr/pTyr-binding forkhead associated (FHA) protein
MSANPTDRATPAVPLPANAPKVRIQQVRNGETCGKAIALRQAITLIGSHDRCKIKVKHAEVAALHSVIVNTGRNVVLRDLGSPKGTRLNDERVDYAVLRDGDVVRVHGFSLKLSIQGAGSGQGGAAWAQLEPSHGDSILIDKDAMTAGRRQDNDLIIASRGVSRCHALLARVGDQLAVCDLNSQNGVKISGRAVESGIVLNGEELRIGGERYRLRIAAESVDAIDLDEVLSDSVSTAAAPEGLAAGPDVSTQAKEGVIANRELLAGENEQRLEDMRSRLEARDKELSEWSRQIELEFKSQDEQLSKQAEVLDCRFEDLDQREEALRSRQAEFTADLDALHQLQEELDGKVAVLEERGRELHDRSAAFLEQEERLQGDLEHDSHRRGELESRESDVQQIENQITQRVGDVESAEARIESQREELLERQRVLDEMQEAMTARAEEQDRLAASLSTWESSMRQLEQDLLTRSQEAEDVIRRADPRDESTGEMDAEALDGRIAELDSREQELAQIEAQLQSQLERVTAQDVDGQDMLAQIQQAAEALDQREQDIVQREQELAQRSQVAHQEADATAHHIVERDQELSHKATEIERLSGELEQRESELQSLESQLSSELNKVEGESRELRDLKLDVENAAAELTRREQNIVALERQARERMNRLEQDLESLDRRDSQAAERERKALRDRADLDARRDALQHEHAEVERLRSTAETTEKTSQRTQLLAEQALHDTRARAEQLDSARTELTDQQESLDNRAAELEHRSAELEARASELDQQGQSTTMQARELEAASSDLAIREQALESDRATLQSRQAELDLQIDSVSAAEQANAEAADVVAAQQTELETVRQQLASTQAALAEREQQLEGQDLLTRELSDLRQRMAELEAELAERSEPAVEAVEPESQPPAIEAVDLSTAQIVTQAQMNDVLCDSTDHLALELEEPAGSASEEPVPAVDFARLDPEIAEAVRMLRRMGVEGEDHELVEQARTEVTHRRRSLGHHSDAQDPR